MLSLILLILTLAISAIVVRVGAIALEITGLSEDHAYFQALSSFAGVGFTTKEAESVVSHPERRRIIIMLIRLGSAGIVTAIATLAGTMVGSSEIADQMSAESHHAWMPFNESQLLLLGVSIALLVAYFLLRQPAVARVCKEIVSVILLRRHLVTALPYEEIIAAGNDYGVIRVEVGAGNPLIGKSVEELRLHDIEATLLCAERSGTTYAYPDTQFILLEGDVCLFFGPTTTIRDMTVGVHIAPAHATHEPGAPLPPGTKAPEIALKDQYGKLWKLSELRGSKNVVLLFYPKDRSYYCSTVVKTFSDDVAKFEALDTVVAAINPASERSHLSFCELVGAKIPILSDTEKKVCRDYRCVALGGLLVDRTCYVIDKSGIVRFSERGRPPLSRVLGVISGMRADL